MKKISSQLAVAAVCCILGFMLSYQLRIISNQELKVSNQRDSSEVTAENDRLKNEKTELEKKIDDLQTQVKGYQDSAVKYNMGNQQLLKDLEESRVLLGNVDVQGPGIILTIVPKNLVFSANMDLTQQVIGDQQILNIINELNFAGAEVITINDIRVTSRTGIKTSSGGTDIIIGDTDKISPYAKITIKAIGDQDRLYAALTFPGVLADPQYKSYQIDPPNRSNNIKIAKSNKVYKFDYAKPVNK
ncbi:MAG: DUF881 domain-containing protein [Bacillota bacterium]|nr:DUF881 domain-containing protein [Bacillota bacterium]